MSVVSKSVVLVLTAAFLAGLCGCSKSGSTPGEKLDNALDATGEKVKEAGEAIKTK